MMRWRWAVEIDPARIGRWERVQLRFFWRWSARLCAWRYQENYQVPCRVVRAQQEAR
jgi:hypothetical protein